MNREVAHNLPDPPYRKFFGRSDAIAQVEEVLLEGGTFIASIDGVGGIGKTALAHYFCQEALIPSNQFSYIVWLTSKKTVFDPFSKETQIKLVNNEFYGVESLIDTTLRVVGFEELIDAHLAEKREFFEYIVTTERIFFVLDNLETIEDDEFFLYITRDFNKFSAKNRYLKILTTSRKRKRIIDFPIEIEGLSTEDALSMLKYLAREFNVKAITNASDFQNLRLLEKVGYVPLGIEFIVGQMALGKTLGEVFRELEGYPSLDGVQDEEEKRQRLSSIILFSFKGMYETLDYVHQQVFKTIAALQRHKGRDDEDISFELIMSLTGFPKSKLDKALDDLLDSKLITFDGNEYSISQMAINFVRQYYEEFESFEDQIIGLKDRIVQGGRNKGRNRADLFLDAVRAYVEENKYEEAEIHLIKSLDVYQDARLYHELAKVQRVLNKFSKASDSFKMATQLEPQNPRIWYDWINMEDSRQRHNVALHLATQALENTGNNVSVLIQMLNIYKFRREYDQIRRKARYFLEKYEENEQREFSRKLLRHWKSIEYHVARGGGSLKYYIEVTEMLLEREDDIETQLQLLAEMHKVIRRKDRQKAKKIQQRMRRLQRKIKSNVRVRVKQLNRMFNQREYERAKKEARKILRWFEDGEEENMVYYRNALRVLMQILAAEEEYESIIQVFREFDEIGPYDDNCVQIYKKAERQLKEQRKSKIIGKISTNIQQAELNIREVVMQGLQSSEQELIELVRSKGKEEWLSQWAMTREKSLKKDVFLIHYADLSHLRALLAWSKTRVLARVSDSKRKEYVKQILKRVVAYLEEYVSQERNETFHSRLQLFSLEELENVLVDTRRLLDTTESLLEVLGANGSNVK